MSLREAAKTFKIPRSTLSDKMAGRVENKAGRPTVLSKEEEKLIVQRIILMGEWGFPIYPKDLRYLYR